MKTRTHLLESLVRLDSPLDEIVSALESHDSDAVDGEALVMLTREQVVSVLQRFLDGDLSAEEVDAWAEALELRDDVDFGTEEDRGAVFDVISEISTSHDLTGPLTFEKAGKLIKELQ